MLLHNDQNLESIVPLIKIIIKNILANGNATTDTDDYIVADCQDILINLLTFRQSNLLELHQDKQFTDMIIDCGLLSEKKRLRNYFLNMLDYVCKNIDFKSNDFSNFIL